MIVWIGFWATAGSLAFLVLDHRVGKRSGRSLLFKERATRLYYCLLAGGVTGALLAYIPIMVFDFGKAIVGLVTDPPPPRLLLGLPFLGAGVAAGFVLVTTAQQRWQTAIHDLRTARVAVGIGNLILAACLFALTMLALWLGTVMGFHIMRDV